MRIEIRNGRIVDASSGVDRVASLYCAHGRVAAMDGAPSGWHADRVLVRIENPRDPDVAPRRRGGVGLENVRRRVQTAFADRGRIEATAEGGSFRVELNLPCVEE